MHRRAGPRDGRGMSQGDRGEPAGEPRRGTGTAKGAAGRGGGWQGGGGEGGSARAREGVEQAARGGGPVGRCTGPRCFSGRGEAPRDYSARIGQRGESSKHQRAPTSEKLLRIHPPRHGLRGNVYVVNVYPSILLARHHPVANDRSTTAASVHHPLPPPSRRP